MFLYLEYFSWLPLPDIMSKAGLDSEPLLFPIARSECEAQLEDNDRILNLLLTAYTIVA